MTENAGITEREIADGIRRAGYAEDAVLKQRVTEHLRRNLTRALVVRAYQDLVKEGHFPEQLLPDDEDGKARGTT
jgi:hypothetical protein